MTETTAPAAELVNDAPSPAADFDAEFASAKEAFHAEERGPEPDAPEAKAEPEPKPAADPDGDTVKQVADGVDKLKERLNQKSAALAQERDARRALEQKLAEQAAKAQPERPDPETDPIGYLKYVEGLISTGQQQTEAQRQQQAQMAQVQDIANQVQDREADFAVTAPDYFDAVEHLKAGRTAEWKALGLSDAEAAQRVDLEALQTAQEMLKRGVDPAKGWYELARTRGFTGKAAEPAQEAAPEPAKPTRLETIREGQKAAVGLSQGGGRANSDPTVESVASLKGAAFDASFDKLRAAAREAEKRTGF